MLIIQGAVSLGLIFALMTMGVYITFRLLEMPDLSVEGSIILGAATVARLISMDINPFVATLVAMLTGSVAGLVTGILHTKLKIPAILSGILTMVASYSIVIRIMGTANIPLQSRGPDRVVSVFTFLQNMGLERSPAIIILSAVVAIVAGALLYCFLGTEIGTALRATGNNRNMVKAQGVNTDATIITALMISNGLVGLAGALWAQQQGFASVDMGAGTIVIGLASLIIAEVLFPVRNVWTRLITIAFGSIIFRLVIALALGIDFMEATDLRLITAIIIAIALSLPIVRNKIFSLFKTKPEDSLK